MNPSFGRAGRAERKRERERARGRELSMLFLPCFMNIEHYGMTVQGHSSSRDFFDQP
jgi:hypothetical protein